MLHVFFWAAAALGSATPAIASDICTQPPGEVEMLIASEAEAIAERYAATGRQLPDTFSYSGRRACSESWTCGDTRTSPRCVSNLLSFLRYNCSDRGSRSEMGYSITDEQYNRLAESRFGGAMMTPPADLVAATRSGSISELTAFLNARGAGTPPPRMTYLRYSSTSINNPPDGYERILVLVEGRDYDQWVQIAIDHSRQPPALGRNVDFIALQKTDDGGSHTPLSAPQMFFRGFSRTSAGFTREGTSIGGHPLTKCYSCHPSGLRTVRPAIAGTRDPNGRPVVAPTGTATEQSFRDRMLDPWGAPRPAGQPSPLPLAGYGPGYDPRENGPVFGPAPRPSGAPASALTVDPEVRWQFVRSSGCARGLSEASKRNVAANMDCARCHDGVNRGLLNLGTRPTTIAHKILSDRVPEAGRMPPDADPELTRPERAALMNCLQQEYASRLRDWLTQSRCEPSTRAPCPPGETGAPLAPSLIHDVAPAL